MKPFFLLLLLIVSGILFDILSRPVGYLAALSRRLRCLPARLLVKKTLQTGKLTGSLGRSLPGDGWRHAAQF